MIMNTRGMINYHDIISSSDDSYDSQAYYQVQMNWYPGYSKVYYPIDFDRHISSDQEEDCYPFDNGYLMDSESLFDNSIDDDSFDDFDYCLYKI